MRITLQSHDRFGEFGEFDTETGKLTVHSKNESSDWKGKLNGWFGTVGNRAALLFRVDHEMHFVYGEVSIPLKAHAMAKIVGGETKRQFTLYEDQKPLITIDYEIAPPVVPPGLYFTQTHPEDFDFLLFVRNVLGNPERRKLAQGLRQP
jgi:hypothetical protein